MPPVEEAYSNPLAPPDAVDASTASSKSKPLRNEDFRRLLSTPRPAGSTGGATAGSFLSPARAAALDVGKKGKLKGGATKKKGSTKPRNEDEDELKQILKNYRDRAKERRDGEEKPTDGEGDMLKLQATAGYRAVAPDDSLGAAERRKQMIHESKYLGGDMEHTHLVKGLDYALLQKVRSEITSIEQEDEDLEAAYQAHQNEQKEIESQIKHPLARNIYQTMFGVGPCVAAGTSLGANELFAPRRMAYVMDVEDELADDIPTTLIRSKADCPQDETSTNLNANDVVIQKLTQVLSYLRADKRKKKDKAANEMKAEERQRAADQGIYDDVGEYEPSRERRANAPDAAGSKRGAYFADSSSRRERERDKDKERERDRRGGGHEARRERETHDKHERRAGRERRDEERPRREAAAKAESSRDSTKPRREDILKMEERPEAGMPLAGVSAKEPIGYDECYPAGLEVMADGDDSDEDADYLEMDPGTKRGPIGRKDFETDDDYNKWRAKRSSMPKSAYQYGVKMSDGRKTRKTGGLRSDKDAERHEKQKIDRQWTQISKILAKRKDADSGGGEDAKRARR